MSLRRSIAIPSLLAAANPAVDSDLNSIAVLQNLDPGLLQRIIVPTVVGGLTYSFKVRTQELLPISGASVYPLTVPFLSRRAPCRCSKQGP